MLELTTPQLGYQGQIVLKDIDLKIEPGERVVIFGPSGAGKSTLLNALYQAASAEAALIPQPQGLVESLSAFHNIAIGRLDQRSLWRNLQILLAPPAAEKQAIASLASQLEIESVLQQPAGNLSGGQQSRVAIARALYRNSDCLLADEPLSALDPRRAQSVTEILKSGFRSIVMTSHDVQSGLALATRVLGIADGRISMDARPADIDPDALERLYAHPPSMQGFNTPPQPAPRGCQ